MKKPGFVILIMPIIYYFKGIFKCMYALTTLDIHIAWSKWYNLKPSPWPWWQKTLKHGHSCNPYTVVSVFQLVVCIILSMCLNLSNTHNFKTAILSPHLIVLKASVSHGGCWGPRWCRGPPLLGVKLGRRPGDVHDWLRLAQGAGPIFYTGHPWHCGQTLGVTSRIKGGQTDKYVSVHTHEQTCLRTLSTFCYQLLSMSVLSNIQGWNHLPIWMTRQD